MKRNVCGNWQSGPQKQKPKKKRKVEIEIEEENAQWELNEKIPKWGIAVSLWKNKEEREDGWVSQKSKKHHNQKNNGAAS